MTRGQLNPSCEGNVKYLPQYFFIAKNVAKWKSCGRISVDNPGVKIYNNEVQFHYTKIPEIFQVLIRNFRIFFFPDFDTTERKRHVRGLN